MPRPPMKRHRLTSKAPLALEKEPQQGSEQHDINWVKELETPASTGQNIEMPSHLHTGAQASEIVRQSHHQTPVARAQEYAIESSPVGDRGATGSRPATRARGYSSTLSVVGRKGDACSKVPGTPAFESSMLSNFRRRPRQPSILQMMQADEGSSDLDDDVFLGGLSPEDESTPLDSSKGKALLMRHAAPPSPSLPASSSGGSRKRKMPFEESRALQLHAEVMEYSPAISSRSSQWHCEHNVPVDSFRAPASPEASSQTLAPPLSSSPPLSPTSTVSTPVPAQLKRINMPAEHVTSKTINLPTSTLQVRLLPRRNNTKRKRLRAKEPKVPSDPTDSDRLTPEQDDVHSVPTKRPSRSRREHIRKKKPAGSVLTAEETQTTAGTAGSRVIGNQNHVTRSSHSNVTAEASGTCEEGHQAMTYSRDSLETTGVVNEIQSGDVPSPLSSLDSEAFKSDLQSESNPEVPFLSEELRLQAKKFADVDKWQLDFEDVIPPASQGSDVSR
ncbi:hypothetical protein BO70DRAFT_391139 [Aspergillus heteromorphus CBS 117.55]|uniref:Uncharacterized protein n=1 Tax=Aspergillus heteromorphus CBS 117.55 TaxID=1448321 RepID=A0A317URP1_9EURO|nr:uncharacterized protein BO70DRAFT_391139 [Aspergillus heteromorphus CBS 117.55]PWY63906.1 hypothetical protein BO70DRAFT_391139 [Aspergillus heteromorphus CBS 117.55]